MSSFMDVPGVKAGELDAKVADRINDPASTSNAAVKTQAAGPAAALAIVFGG